MKRIVLTLFLIGGYILRLSGQEVVFMSPPETIGLHETIELGMSIRGDADKIIPVFPEIKGFVKTGSGSGQSWINGDVSLQYTTTYQAVETGIFSIPACRVNVNGKIFKDSPRKIRVTNSPRNQGRPGNSVFDDFFNDNPFSAPQNLKFTSLPADIHLNLKFSKPVCYVGEQIIYEVHLYVNERDAGKIKVSGEAIRDLQLRMKNPDFWDDQIDFTDIPMEIRKVNGQTYRIYTLYKTILFPLRAGRFPFQNIWLNVERLQVATGGSIIDQIRNYNTRFETIKTEAKPFTLEVREIPPHDWNQSPPAGIFSMEISPVPDTIRTDEGYRFQVNILGNGNMDALPTPEFQVCGAAELIPAGKNADSRKTTSGMYGETRWTWDLDFHQSGICSVGPVIFRYLNPETGKFDSLVAPQKKVYVLPSQNPASLHLDPIAFYPMIMSEENTKPIPDIISVFEWATCFLLGGFWLLIFFRIKRKTSSPDQNKA